MPSVRGRVVLGVTVLITLAFDPEAESQSPNSKALAVESVEPNAPQNIIRRPEP